MNQEVTNTLYPSVGGQNLLRPLWGVARYSMYQVGMYDPSIVYCDMHCALMPTHTHTQLCQLNPLCCILNTSNINCYTNGSPAAVMCTCTYTKVLCAYTCMDDLQRTIMHTMQE